MRDRRGRPQVRLRWVSLIVGLFLLFGLGGSKALAQEDVPPGVLNDPRWTAFLNTTVFYETTISIPTYPYADYLESAYDPTYNMTYPVLDWDRYEAADPQPTPRLYQLLVMENAYLKVTLLPELGGRIYQLIDKTTGHNQLYQNPVIKPTAWGPPEQGWWLAVGGVEWGLPVEEHGYEWGQPWTWSRISSTEGVTITVQDTAGTHQRTAGDRICAAIDIHLPADRAYLVVEPRLENPTSESLDYKFWINAALAPGPANTTTEGFTFVFNAPEMSVHSTDDDRLPGAMPTVPSGPDYRFSWPEYEGVDYAKLRNWHEWLGFFEYPQATKGFIGAYDDAQGEGVLRIFPPEIATGAKGFAVGWGDDALPSWLWTDGDTTGAEVHGGVAPTFWDAATLAAGEVTTWREVWYPVRNLAGTDHQVDISAATEEGVLDVSKSGDLLHIEVLPTRYWASGETELYVWQRTTCTELAHWRLLSLGPTDGYENNLYVGDLTLDELSVAFVRVADQHVLIAYGPYDCLNPSSSEAHLGYGVNICDISHVTGLVDPLGFEWVKLWEEYSGLPAEPMSKHVLYNVDLGAYVNDLNGWRLKIRGVAQQGISIVRAYEIGNEPNVRNANWGGLAPDPQRLTELLCIAYDEIKAADPTAYVISGGLAPVGRLAPCDNPLLCNAIDERVYLQAMLDYGAAACMDGFGYHPYGFAYPPERDPLDVSNGFAFRGVEKMHDILVAAGFGEMPIWATEFNWIRQPEDDGYEFNCDVDPDYSVSFLWQEVSAATQADYLVRAFQYADEHWPWMQGMFVWNLDWHNYKTSLPCFHARYYALRRHDGSDLGAPTLAYDALAAMVKRPWAVTPAPPRPPRLAVTPATIGLISEVAQPRILTATFAIANTGSGTLTWTAVVSPQSTLEVTLTPAQGTQVTPLSVGVDTAGLATGYYTATLVIDAEPSTTLGVPQIAEVRLHVVDELARSYLPAVLRSYAAPTPSVPPPPVLTPIPSTPEGPSKIGTHAIGDGGTTALVQQVAAAGGHVALVKGLTSFGYLCEVKQISPQTVTIGRWQSAQWEAVVAGGSAAEKAADYMDEHMGHWEEERACVDYWEVLNEVDPPTISGHVWLAEFYKAAMAIAEANGYKLAIFSYSMGVPEIYEWEAIADTNVFAHAKAGGHILALHEYGGPLLSDLWGEPLPTYPGQDPEDPSLPRYADRGVLGGRYRHLYRDILIPRNQVIPLAITEANLAIDDADTRAAYFLDDIAWYDDRLREDDYVLGMAIF
ncbi:MAG: DUF5107 domain-containing protein, partial [Anaerolineae bacterium]|nr:DUF5107 domain-containing protein [Anaerolineae bacterium]